MIELLIVMTIIVVLASLGMVGYRNSVRRSEEAVLKNKEDVPGYLEADAYGLFKYDEGLTYQ